MGGSYRSSSWAHSDCSFRAAASSASKVKGAILKEWAGESLLDWVCEVEVRGVSKPGESGD